VVTGLGTENINWNDKIKRDKNRYYTVYNEDGKLIEVHDLKTGDIWFKVDMNRWMRL
jgi:hypothetical protein